MGINAPTSNFTTINIDPGADITTAGNSVVVRGGTVNIAAGSTIQSTAGAAITMGHFSGSTTTVNIEAGGTVSGGIFLDNTANQIVNVRGTVDTVTLGSNTPFVQSLNLYSTGSITGGASAAASVSATQVLSLSGITTDGMFNTDRIGTDILNFDVMRKSDSGTWTLTGTNAVDWQIFGGQLIGTTANIANVYTGGGSILRLDQAGSGTYGSVISGTGSLEVTGGGNITLSNANTHTGGTTVDNSTLSVSANNNLGGAGSVTLMNGGIYNATSNFSTSRDFILNNGGTLNATGGIFSGAFSGTGGLTKTGAGQVTIDGFNTYTGGTTISGAGSSINIISDFALGNLANSVTLENGATLRFQTNITSARDIILNSGDGIIETGASNPILTGTISGSGRLIKYLSGRLTLSGNNTYTGGTEISGGPGSSLLTTSDSNLGAASGNVLIDLGLFQYGASYDTARDFTFAGASSKIDTQAFSSIISGDLSGVGIVGKYGSGTLTLTGSSTKTGGFDIQAGTLVGNTGNLTGNISNASTLRFDQAVAGTYASVISGAGDFVKQGLGNLILSGTNTYTGTTTVNAGRLAVNGSIASSAVTVNANGNLGGSGTIGTLAMNGRLTPGNSIGTLTAGNTTFNTGSLYQVEIDDALNSDLLAITGTLDINAGSDVSILAAAGAYADGSLYTIITHTGARTGTFTSISDNLAFLTASLIYNPNDIQVLLTSNGVSFSNVGKDRVQYDTGNALEDLGAGNPLYDAFIGLTVTDAQNALDTLSGEHIPGVTGAMAQTTGVIRTALTTRMQAITYNRGGALSAALAPAAGNDGGMSSEYTASFIEPAAGNAQLRDGSSRVWMEAFGTTGQSDSRGTASKQDRGSAGLLAGIDGELDDDTYVGLFGGYEQGEVNTYSERASSAITNYHAGMYAVHQFDPIRLSGGIGGTYHAIETQRYVVFPGFSENPESDTNGYTASAFIEASHPFELSNNWAAEPFAGVSVTYSHMDGYEETGGGASNLAVDDVNATTPTHTLGMRFGKTLTTENDNTIHLSGSLGWQHSYGDLDDKATMHFTSGTTNFTTMGPGRTRDAALVGLGVDAKMGNTLNSYGGYNATLSSEAQDHSFTAGIKLAF